MTMLCGDLAVSVVCVCVCMCVCVCVCACVCVTDCDHASYRSCSQFSVFV